MMQRIKAQIEELEREDKQLDKLTDMGDGPFKRRASDLERDEQQRQALADLRRQYKELETMHKDMAQMVADQDELIQQL